MKSKFGIRIMPREVILDTQGRAVEQTLSLNHFPASKVRVGRFVEIEIEADSEQIAISKVEEMARFVLYNPLIETYEISKL